MFWDEEEQKYIIIPDGDIASHEEIHEYFKEEYIGNHIPRIN